VGRTRGDSFKLKEGRFTLDISKKFITMRLMRHRNRMPREVVGATFQARLGRALRNLL